MSEDGHEREKEGGDNDKDDEDRGGMEEKFEEKKDNLHHDE